MDHKQEGVIESEYLVLGQKLAKIRGDAGLTQRQVAERAGIGRPTLANIEKGRQRVLYHQLLDIARALGSDPRELLPAPAFSSPSLDQLGGYEPPTDVIDWVRRAMERTTEENSDTGN